MDSEGDEGALARRSIVHQRCSHVVTGTGPAAKANAFLDPWLLRLEDTCQRALEDVSEQSDLETSRGAIDKLLGQFADSRQLLLEAAESTKVLTTELLLSSRRHLVSMAERGKSTAKKDLDVAADAHLQQCLCQTKEGKRWSLAEATPDALKVYGTGIRLHFAFLRVFTRVFFVAAILSIPLVIFSASGSHFERFDTGDALETGMGQLAKTTIGNFDHSQNITAWCSTWDARDAATLCGIFDAAIALMIFAAALWFELILIPQVVEDEQQNIISPVKFAVYVDALPEHLPGGNQGYQAEIKAHFERLLRAEVTAECAINGLRVVQPTRDVDAGAAPQKGPCPCGPGRAAIRDHPIGHIVHLGPDGRSCEVQWPGCKDAEKVALRGEDGRPILYDAALLRELDHMGLYTLDDDGGPEEGAASSLVYQVGLVRDFGGKLRQLKREKKAGESRMDLGGAAQEPGGSGGFFDIAASQSTCAKHWVRLHDRGVLGAFVVFNKIAYRDFLFDEYRFSHTMLGRALQPWKLKFHGAPIRVQEACTPSDIYWAHLDYPKCKRRLRSGAVVLGCVLLLLVCIGLLGAAKQARSSAQASVSGVVCASQLDQGAAAQSTDCQCSNTGYARVLKDQPPGIRRTCRSWLMKQARASILSNLAAIGASLVNFAAGYVVLALARFDFPKHVTAFKLRTFRVAFVVKLLTLGVILVLINADFRIRIAGIGGIFGIIGDGDYTDIVPLWFALVGQQVLTVIMYASLNPLLDATQGPLFRLYIWWYAEKTEDWVELKKLYTPPDFQIAMLRADQLSAIFATLIFSSGMPLLMVFLGARMALSHWSDLYTLLRASRNPPRFTHHIAVSASRWLQSAVWVHAAGAVWLYGNPELFPSYCLSCGAFTRDTGDDEATRNRATTFMQDTSTLFGESHIMDRFFRSSALPNVLVLVLVTAIVGLRSVMFVLGKGFINHVLSSLGALCGKCKCYCLRRGGRGKRESIFDDEFGHRPLKEMVRMQLAHSYNITDDPRYAFLAEQEEASLARQEDGDCGAAAVEDLAKAAVQPGEPATIFGNVLPSGPGDGGEPHVRRRGGKCSEVCSSDHIEVCDTARFTLMDSADASPPPAASKSQRGTWAKVGRMPGRPRGESSGSHGVAPIATE